MTLAHIVSWNVLLMKKIEKTKQKTSRKGEREVTFQVFYKNQQKPAESQNMRLLSKYFTRTLR